MAQREATPGEHSFKDRRTRLLVLGALSILVGVACILLGGLPMLLIALPKTVKLPGFDVAQGEWGAVLTASLLYELMGAVFIWSGVGSMRAQRWVRPVMLMVSWTWLLAGLALLVLLVLIEDQFLSSWPGSEALPSAAMAVAGIAAAAVLVVMDILLPAVFIWGYRSQDVRLTCEARHPAPSWTDRCPPQVLAWSITLWGCALLVIPALFRPALPVFGYVVSGMPARLLLLSSGAVAGILAWGSYALRMPAWWGSALFLLVTGASAVTSFLRMDLIEICRAMNMPEEEIQVLRQFGTPSCSALVAGTAALTGLGLGYLLFMRKHFMAGQEGGGYG
ncbi:MAG: hypothetical protein DMF49_03795 [Acidobacteria bacterium]|nr:MAG: hypothetical protein DMF49_03795 [Acidobacteriota bacterium]